MTKILETGLNNFDLLSMYLFSTYNIYGTSQMIYINLIMYLVLEK